MASRDRWVKHIDFFHLTGDRPQIVLGDMKKYLFDVESPKFYFCEHQLKKIAEYFSETKKECHQLSRLLFGNFIYGDLLFKSQHRRETALRLMKTFLIFNWMITETKLRDILCFYLLHVNATNFPQEFEHAQKVLKSLQSTEFDPFQWRDDLWKVIDVLFFSEYWRPFSSHAR